MDEAAGSKAFGGGTVTVSTPPGAMTLPAQAADTLGDLVDNVAAVDAMIRSLSGYKAELIDRARMWSEVAENAITLVPEGRDKAAIASGAVSRMPAWSPRVIARRTLVSELACALRIPQTTAENLVEESHTLLHELPATLTALQKGAVSYRHAKSMIDQANSLPVEARHDFEEALVASAQSLTAAKFERKARVMRERLHPESITVRHTEAVEKRYVGVQPGRDGMSWLTAYLPAPSAEAIDNRLTDIARHLKTSGEDRTQTQLRADAFADLLIDGTTKDTGVKHGGIRPTVMVTVPALTLLGRSEEPATLEGYGPIDPDTARDLAGRAKSFIRILTHPETGAVLSLGRTRYKVPKDLRIWLRLRDGTCRFAGCNRKAAHSDIDHTKDWQYLGRTEFDNLAHLCRGSHNLKHQTRWTVSQPGKDGTLVWTSPLGKTYLTEPEVRMQPWPGEPAKPPDEDDPPPF